MRGWCRLLADGFLRKLIASPQDLEVLADKGTDIWTWRWHFESSPKFKFPKYWFVQEPKVEDLVPIKDSDNSLWPFVINETRYGIKGKGEKGGEPFVYA